MSRVFTKNTANYASYGVNKIGALLSGATKYAVAVWVKPASFSPSSNVDNTAIVAGIDSTVSGFSIGVDSTSGTARVVAHSRSRPADSRQVRAGTTRTVAAGSWQLLGADFDVAGATVTPRHNGVADGAGSVTYGATTYTQGTPSGVDRVGADLSASGPGSTAAQFDGEIAHLAIWKFTGSDTGLTQAEWDALAAGALPNTIQAAKLVLYTPLAGTANPEPSTVGSLPLTLTGSVPAGSNAPPDSLTLSMTGPSSGLVGVASSNFTVTATGTITGTLTVTPSDGGGGGSFSPTTLALTSGTPSGTFTYTPASAGAKTISLSNNGGANNPAPITYTAGTSNTITLTDVADLRIVQRSGTVGALAIAGTHNGATSVQARVVQHGTSTVVLDWTTIDAAPGASTFSGTLTGIPQGGWYNVQVRQGNSTATTSNGANRFGVGALYCFAGQSNAQNMFLTSGSTSPNSTTSRLSGSSWATNTGAGAVAFANAMNTALGIPVGVLDTGIGGASLTPEGSRGFGIWLDLVGACWTGWQSRVNTAGGKIEGVIWLQGEADAFQAVAGSTYTAGLATLFGRMRSHLGQPSLPVFMLPLPRTSHVDADDDAWNVINDCILAAATTSTEILAADTWDLPMADSAHYTATGYATLSGRIALAVRKYLGASVESRGPYIASARFSGSTVVVSLAHRGGSDISPSTGITGLRFVANGSVITPTSVVRSGAAQITATFAAPIVGPLTVAVAWGMMPATTGVPVDGAGLPLSKTASVGITATDGNRSVSMVLTTDGTTPAANLSGLRWAWFDQATPDAMLAPTDKGTGESTDATGLLVIPLANTAKLSGETGWLIVTNSDGTTTQSPGAKAFSGPVQVA